jgi:hypothetical protein
MIHDIACSLFFALTGDTRPVEGSQSTTLCSEFKGFKIANSQQQHALAPSKRMIDAD